MTRGGLGVRKALSEKIAKASRGYRLIGIRAGSRVSETDKYRRWHVWHHEGTIMRLTVNQVTVQWDGDQEFTYYTAEEARYRVDTNRWRIVPPTQASPLTALTSGGARGSIAPSPQKVAIETREEVMAETLTAAQIDSMTLPQLRTAANKVFDPDDIKGLRKAQLIEMLKEYYADDEAPEADDEIDDEADDIDVDEVEEDEVDEPEPLKKAAPKSKTNDAPAGHKPDTKRQTPPEPNGDTLTAKQVATRIGTDAKTLRKFFRSPASTVEAVGQGGRYEFAKDDLEKIKAEFEAWKSGTKGRGRPASSATKSASKKAPVQELEEDEEIDDEEPTDGELDELEDDEIDDTELSLDDDELDE